MIKFVTNVGILVEGNWYSFRVDNFDKRVLLPFWEKELLLKERTGSHRVIILTFTCRRFSRRDLVCENANRKS